MKTTILSIFMILLLNLPVWANSVPEWKILSHQTKKELKNEGIDFKIYEKVTSGKIVTNKKETPSDKSGVHVVAFGIVKGTAESTFDVIENCPELHEFMPHFTGCKEVKPDVKIAENEKWTENKLSFGYPPLKYNVTIVEHIGNFPPNKLTWKKVKGDMKVNEGYYRIISLDKNHQFLIYDVITDVGSTIPYFIQTMLTENDLPGVISAIQKRVESIK